MALAHVIKSLPAIDGIKLDPLALIVDHHVRPSSTEEARQVQRELARIGITATVLDMVWDQNTSPPTWPNFESEARVKRYKLIARAALRHRIHHVFTGHHLDDQIETGIMRLAFQQHKNLFGLRGIPKSSSMPCVDDMQGTHEDQSFWQSWTDADIRKTNTTQLRERRLSNIRLPADDNRSFFRPGGLMLHRPLLDFPKVDLITTCRQNGVSFVTDRTNHDPTFTRRNAVRVMRSSKQLPKALAPSRISKLQKLADQQLERCLSSGFDFLGSFVIQKLDLTSGTLEVQLPSAQSLDSEQTRGLSNAIARLTGVITPCGRDEMPLQVPGSVLSCLFPNISATMHSTDVELGTSHEDVSFNFRRVNYVRLNEEGNAWLLRRQPLRLAEVTKATSSFSTDLEHNDGGGQDEGYRSCWKLWDNRFWIRLFCQHRGDFESIQICPLTEQHLRELRSFLRKHKSDDAKRMLVLLNKSLSTSAPGKMRFTLPALVLCGRIIELPTLNLHFTKLQYPDMCEIRSEVTYKTIEGLERLRITQKGRGQHPGHTTQTLGDILKLQR